MITVGVIGYGYWGPNLVRNFAELPDARVAWVTDLRRDRLAPVTARSPANFHATACSRAPLPTTKTFIEHYVILGQSLTPLADHSTAGRDLEDISLTPAVLSA